MSEKELVTVKVSETQKKNWKDFAEECPDATSLSHLVRLSVTREMARANDEDPEANAVEADLGDVPDTLERIEDTLGDMATRIDKLEANSGSGDEDTPLHLKLQDYIPKLPSENECWMWIQQRMTDEGDLKSEVIEEKDRGRSIASVTRLASHLGRTEPEVRQAAYRLEKGSSGSYQTFSENGEVFIFQVVGKRGGHA